MKLKFSLFSKYLFTFFIFYSVSVTYSQIWIEQNSGVLFHLNSAAIIDKNNVFVVGNGGTILHTIDGGNTWNNINSGITNNLKKVIFVSDSTGWCVGYNGTILKTTDMGHNWDIQNTNSAYNLHSTYFLDSDTGWACGSNGVYLSTTDGGQIWLETTLNHSVVGKRNHYDIYFDDSQTGWIVASGFVIFYTTDGGANWNPNWGGGAGEDISSITRTSNHLYLCAKYPEWIFKSDGDNNWYQIGGNDFIANSIYFIDDFHGWIAGEDGKISYTTTGGDNWWTQNVANGITLNDVKFLTSNQGWAVGNSGKIFYTKEGDTVSIDNREPNEPPVFCALYDNYPNPFNPRTRIKYYLERSSTVKLIIFNHLGQEIKKLVNKRQTSGKYQVDWNGTNNYGEKISSGIYFYRLETDGFIHTRKMTLIR